MQEDGPSEASAMEVCRVHVEQRESGREVARASHQCIFFMVFLVLMVSQGKLAGGTTKLSMELLQTASWIWSLLSSRRLSLSILLILIYIFSH
ncbi:hypothetical protein MUK42_37415 [Musa troglodytarum]|uniref:Uncharacterized protein n=1 Tax=Musa troglodytarum TaxID=320322 RepID=A0A9E7GBF7_9LILI|nr:hypothetical protein MUK42_37415 [Musa troglodytarum]